MQSRIILDGEMLVWDPASERYLPFGNLKTAASGKWACTTVITYLLNKFSREKCCFESETMLCVNHIYDIFDRLIAYTVKVFDLLYLNGLSLINKSLKFRKRNLRSCLSEVSGRLEFAEEHEGRTAKDIRTRMDAVLATRGEGIVIKHPDSGYVLNGRNKDWIKVCTPSPHILPKMNM